MPTPPSQFASAQHRSFIGSVLRSHMKGTHVYGVGVLVCGATNFYFLIVGMTLDKYRAALSLRPDVDVIDGIELYSFKCKLKH